MVLRRLVLIVGALIVIVGLSQVVAPGWWLGIMPSLLSVQGLRVIGLVAFLVGIVLILAAGERKVALGPFVFVLGVLMVLGGAAMLLSPVHMKDTVYGFFLNKPHGSQLTWTWIAGLIRAAIGVLILWAATHSGRYTGARHARA